MKGPKKIEDLPESSKTIFKHRHCGWLHWQNVCNVVKSAVYDYSDEEPLGHLKKNDSSYQPDAYILPGQGEETSLGRPVGSDESFIRESLLKFSKTGKKKNPASHNQNDINQLGSTQVYDTPRGPEFLVSLFG